MRKDWCCWWMQYLGVFGGCVGSGKVIGWHLDQVNRYVFIPKLQLLPSVFQTQIPNQNAGKIVFWVLFLFYLKYLFLFLSPEVRNIACLILYQSCFFATLFYVP